MPQNPDNFFKLKLIHPVVIDFYNDHVKTMKLYEDSYEQIEMFDNENLFDDYQARIELVTAMKETYSQMNEVFNNLLMSYYSFKKQAETDEKLMKEFKKIPDNFMVLEKHVLGLIDCYEDISKKLQVIL